MPYQLKRHRSRFVLWAVLSAAVLPANGQAPLFPRALFPAGQNSSHVLLADVNQDGKLDAITSIYEPGSTASSISVLFGKGDKTFAAPITTFITDDSHSFIGDFAVGDVNGDGKPDLVVTVSPYPFPGYVQVFLGNGDGTFQAGATYNNSNTLYYIILQDVNVDGKPDLVTFNSGVGPYAYIFGVQLGNGDGTFKPQQAANIGGIVSAVADFDGDGIPDAIVTGSDYYSSDNGIGFYKGNGDGTFQGTGLVSPPGTGYPAAFTDVDGDGKRDLITLAAYDWNSQRVPADRRVTRQWRRDVPAGGLL